MKFELALITGASSGIGRALAILLAQKKIPLILCGRDEARLSQVAKEIGGAQTIVADLEVTDEKKKVIEAIETQVPDLLINNAGYGLYGTPFTLEISQQLSLAHIDALVPLELSLVAIRSLKKHHCHGTILNVSSVSGEHPCPGMSVYGASKAFLTHLSQGLHTEVKSFGIDVLVSCPGMVATEFATRAARKKMVQNGGPILSAEFVAQEIWRQIMQRREKSIINWYYRLGSSLAKYFIPNSLIKKLIWKRIKKRL